MRSFFQTVAHAPSERSIAVALLDASPGLTGADATGFYAMRTPNEPSEIHLRGTLMDSATLDLYEAHGRAIDPLLRWVSDHHVAGQASSARLFAMSDEYRRFASSLPTLIPRQYMLAPIVVGNEMVGIVHFAGMGDVEFDAGVGSAISLHISNRVAVLRALDGVTAKWDGVLSPREQEMADLAARGLSTHEMARAVGISENTVKRHLKSLYAKLGVTCRVELSRLLLRGPGALERTGIVLPAGRSVHGGAMEYRY